MRDVNANPMAVELLCNLYRCAAATERIENYIAFVGTCFQDAFEQGLGFLSWVTETFLGLGVDRRNVDNDILHRHAVRKIALEARKSFTSSTA